MFSDCRLCYYHGGFIQISRGFGKYRWTYDFNFLRTLKEFGCALCSNYWFEVFSICKKQRPQQEKRRYQPHVPMSCMCDLRQNDKASSLSSPCASWQLATFEICAWLGHFRSLRLISQIDLFDLSSTKCTSYVSSVQKSHEEPKFSIFRGGCYCIGSW